MSGYKQIKINNSKNHAIKNKWKDPGAELYDQLLNAFYCDGEIPNGSKELDNAIKNGKYKQWPDLLKEAYLIAPINNIKNSPYGITPHSRSGCKYPHHVIKDGELVLSIQGLKHAYEIAWRYNELNANINRHLNRHFRELGIRPRFHHGQMVWLNENATNLKIEENFKSIEKYIFENTGIDLHCPTTIYEEDTDNDVIRPLMRDDVINPYFINWLFKSYEFSDDDPEKFDYDILVNNDDTGNYVHGYFVNDKLEGIIKVKYRKPEDYYAISMLFVNDKNESKGIGQSLIKYAINKYGDKEMRLNVFEFNSKAMHIYKKYGFDVVSSDVAKPEADGDTNKLVGQKFYKMVRKPSSDKNDLSDIESPEELLKWMDCIQYGWVDKSGNICGTGDEDDEKHFFDDYRLQSPEQLIKSKIGVCWDQSELERRWFSSHGYPHAVIYLEIDDGWNCPSHTFLLYMKPNDIDRVYWFEHSWGQMKGIHRYLDVMDCIRDVAIKHQMSSGATGKIIIKNITIPPKSGSTCEKFMNHCRNSSTIETDHSCNNILNESIDILDLPIFETDSQDSVKNKKNDFVPIYGIVKSYSRSLVRNDGTPKSDSELASVKFDKIISRLTRGDNYSHALVSFDDSLTQMYSYEDEGFVIDNIMEKDSWMGTKSIYICVMFVNREDRNRMERYVKNLKRNAHKSKYASANLLKAYIGTPRKVDKRFVCSSFTGYIMSCSNPKNLHRDYSRLRPEDITILPRAFYLMNVRDREDFKSKRHMIQEKVKKIYDEYYDEIDDYNNHLPKLMLKDRCDRLKTLDKIFDWIIDNLT